MWASLKSFGHKWLRGFDYVALSWLKSDWDEHLETSYHRAGTDRIVDELIARSAVRAEFVITICRCVFLLLILARFLLIEENASGSGLARAAIEVPVLLGTTALLAVLIVIALRSPEHIGRLLHASVLLDVVACSMALLPGVLYPWQAYRGLLCSPDVAMILVLCVSSGLRFSLSAAWLGVAVNALGLSVLLVLDRWRNASLLQYGPEEIVLYAIYFTGAASLGVTLATRGHRLAGQAARYAIRATAAREGLMQTLRDSHDAGSLLSAARIHADILHRRAEADVGATSRTRAELRALCGSLSQLADVVSHSRANADSGIFATESRVRIDVGETIALATRRATHRFPQVEFRCWCGNLELEITGGHRALTSVFFNLLINACEGDGERGASEVWLDVRAVPDAVVITVADDGPGFATRQAAGTLPASTKPSGGGAGLYLVKRVVAANQGTLRCETREEGGALVTVVLPHQSASLL